MSEQTDIRVVCEHTRRAVWLPINVAKRLIPRAAVDYDGDAIIDAATFAQVSAPRSVKTDGYPWKVCQCGRSYAQVVAWQRRCEVCQCQPRDQRGRRTKRAAR